MSAVAAAPVGVGTAAAPFLAELPDGPLPDRVKLCAYHVSREALANAARHADAPAITLYLATPDGKPEIEVADDGVGGAHPAGDGLRGLLDRVNAVGGCLQVDSPAGGGTRLLAKIPISAPVEFQGTACR